MTTWWRTALALLVPLASIASCGGDTPAHDAPLGDDGGAPDASLDPTDPPDAGDPDAAPQPDSTSRSGTRLRRHLIEAGPGAARTAEFWDTELDVACSFHPGPGGVLRCLPKLDAVYFTTSTCTGQVVMLSDDDSCERPFGGRSYTDPLYQRTTEPASLDGLVAYVLTNDGACDSRIVAPDTKAWVAEEIPFARFVAGTAEDEPRSSGLVARYVNGDDGSRILASTVDTVRNTVCDLHVEPGRCVPAQRGVVGLFADATCTSRVGLSGTEPDILLEPVRTANGCPAGANYYAVGAKLASDEPVYALTSGGTCTAGTKLPQYSYYRVGAPVSVSSFPKVDLALEGTGRLRTRRHVDTEGKPLEHAHTFWDSERDAECTPALFSDGTYRCLPSDGGLVDGWFADPGCSSQPLGHYECNDAPGPYMAALSARWYCAPAGMLGFEQLYQRGGEVTGQAYSGGTFCTPQNIPSILRLFGIAGVASLSELPQVELKVEPKYD